MVRLEDIQLLVCPTCRGALGFTGDAPAGRLERGALRCAGCGAAWSVNEGLCRLYREDQVRGNDRLLRYFYNGLPALHDPVVRYTLPLFQSGTERALRNGYMPRLELSRLTPRRDGRPARILEVGVGSGANLALIRRDVPRGLPFELWGVDLSLGMLSVLRRRRGKEAKDVRLLVADAHALPFPDSSFDRVFHVGGIGGYRDPARALAEMARVAEVDTPIVVVDEQLDPGRRHNLYHRLIFRLVTFYDRHPHSPVEHVPTGATAVTSEQVSKFFYCLSFRMGALRGEPRNNRSST